jgi:hypothetical protein
MVYTGSFGGISNQEDWNAQIALLNEDNSAFSVLGASISMFVCREGQSSAALVKAATSDGTIIIAGDGSSFSWTVPAASMQQLRPEVYNVFVRMTLNGLTSQLVSAQLTVIDGGPAT